MDTKNILRTKFMCGHTTGSAKKIDRDCKTCLISKCYAMTLRYTYGVLPIPDVYHFTASVFMLRSTLLWLPVVHIFFMFNTIYKITLAIHNKRVVQKLKSLQVFFTTEVNIYHAYFETTQCCPKC